MYKKLTYRLKNGCNYFQRFDLNSYDDRVDASPEISLFEYHVIRNSKTGKTLFWHPTLENKKVEKSGYVSIAYISPEDVISAINSIDIDYFEFIGRNKSLVFKELSENAHHLSNFIQSINQWNGWFYT